MVTWSHYLSANQYCQTNMWEADILVFGWKTPSLIYIQYSCKCMITSHRNDPFTVGYLNHSS